MWKYDKYYIYCYDQFCKTVYSKKPYVNKLNVRILKLWDDNKPKLNFVNELM